MQILTEMAVAKGRRPGQLALAWLLAQPLDVVPIPGTKRLQYVQENAAATSVAVSADEIAYLGDLYAPGRIVGGSGTTPLTLGRSRPGSRTAHEPRPVRSCNSSINSDA